MGKKITHTEAVERLSLNNKNVKFLTEYIGSESKSKFRCLICNFDWICNARGVINGKNGCPECGKKKARETKKYNITTENFKKKLEKVFGDKISVLGEYKSYNIKINVICNICKYEWSSKPVCLIAKHGCCKCGHNSKGLKHRKTNIDYLNEIDEIHDGRISLLEDYKTNRSRINVKCNICNYEWFPVAGQLRRRGCPKCNFSKGELLIQKILKELNINFKSQVVIEGVKTYDNGTPIFDFTILNNNKIETIIEYDGEQHFKPIKKWGGEKRFKQQQKIDQFKNEYCLINDIQMVRIPYTDFEKINIDYIKELLCRVKK